MTGLELFAFVIMPVSLVAIGGLAAFLHNRSLRRHHTTPAE